MNATIVQLLLCAPFLLVALITGIIFLISGYKKGLWRALISLGATLVSTALSLLLANLFSASVAGLITTLIPADFFEEIGVLAELAFSFVKGVVSSVLSLVLFSFLLFIFLIISKLVTNRIKKQELATEKKSMKWAGLGVRLVDTVLVTLLLLMPVYGLIATYVSPATAIIHMVDPTAAASTEILQAVGNHPIVEVYKVGPAAWVNQGLSSFQVEGTTVDPAKITSTVENVTKRVAKIASSEDIEQQLRLSSELMEYLDNNVIRERWCYELIDGAKNMVDEYLPLLSEEEKREIAPLLSLLDLSYDEYVVNTSEILDFAQFTLENEIIPLWEKYENGEEAPEELPFSDEFYTRMGKLINCSEQFLSLKKFGVTLLAQDFIDSKEEALQWVEEYWVDGASKEADYNREARAYVDFFNEQGHDGFITFVSTAPSFADGAAEALQSLSSFEPYEPSGEGSLEGVFIGDGTTLIPSEDGSYEIIFDSNTESLKPSGNSSFETMVDSNTTVLIGKVSKHKNTAADRYEE